MSRYHSTFFLFNNVLFSYSMKPYVCIASKAPRINTIVYLGFSTIKYEANKRIVFDNNIVYLGFSGIQSNTHCTHQHTAHCTHQYTMSIAHTTSHTWRHFLLHTSRPNFSWVLMCAVRSVFMCVVRSVFMCAVRSVFMCAVALKNMMFYDVCTRTLRMYLQMYVCTYLGYLQTFVCTYGGYSMKPYVRAYKPYVCICTAIDVDVCTYVCIYTAKEPLIIGLFCGKWPVNIRHFMTLWIDVGVCNRCPLQQMLFSTFWRPHVFTHRTT